MHKVVSSTVTLAIAALLVIGCSSGNVGILTPDETTDESSYSEITELAGGGDSERMLWGIWSIGFDTGEMVVTIQPLRNLQAHFDITYMVTPPKCYDCITVTVNSFNSTTRILDADITLRNPCQIQGRDVRGILYTNDCGHRLINADSWTGLWDVLGGMDINPFKAFAKGEPYRIFAGFAVHTEKYRIYIPKPPQYNKITFAVDASWPGNCKEPYAITNFWQELIIDTTISSGSIYVDVYDWQGDVNTVTLIAPEITGEAFSPLTPLVGDIWMLELKNSFGLPAGLYETQLMATSLNSEALALWDVLIITITETPTPKITGAIPAEGPAGYKIPGVQISGNYFVGPGIGVKLKRDGEPDIVADNVVSEGGTTIMCDIDIPLITTPGLYDIEVTNWNGKSGIGKELFTILETPFGWGRSWGYVNEDYGCDVAVDHHCNVYVTGGFNGSVDFDPGPDSDTHTDYGYGDVYVTKYNSSGIFQWARTWGGSEIDCGYAIALDETGNVYVAGGFSSTVDFDPGPGVDEHTAASSLDAFLCKYDPNGNFIWAGTWGSGYIDVGEAVIVDGYGDIYVTGGFFSTVDFDPGPGVDNHKASGDKDAFMSKFDADGNFLWAHTWGANSSDNAQGVGVDFFCYTYVTGLFAGTVDFDPGPGIDEHTADGHDHYLCKFDSSGAFQWVRHWGAEATYLDEKCDIAVDYYGNCHITGAFEGTVDFDPGEYTNNHTANGVDIFLSKIDTDGDFHWARTWGGDDFIDIFLTLGDTARGVEVDYYGNAYVTGCYNDLADFDPGPGFDQRLANYKRDIFLSKLDTNGIYQWAVTWGGSDDADPTTSESDDGLAVALDVYGNPHVAGIFYSVVNFDPGEEDDIHISHGDCDAFVIKFLPDGYW